MPAIVNLKNVVDTAVTTNIAVNEVKDSINKFTSETVPNSKSELELKTTSLKSDLDSHTATKIDEYNTNYLNKVDQLSDIADTVVVDANKASSIASLAASSAEDYKSEAYEYKELARQKADLSTNNLNTITEFKDTVRVDKDHVEKWHKEVSFIKETVDTLLYRAETYADLPDIGKTGTTYVVLEDETRDPAGQTTGYRWNPLTKEYVPYVSGLGEGANTFTDEDKAFLGIKEDLNTDANILPLAINEVKQEFEDKLGYINANQDNINGIITNPTVIPEDSTISIPENRQVMLSKLDVEGELNIDGCVTIVEDPTEPAHKVVLTAPNNSKWSLSVDNDGNLITKKV